MQPLVLFSTCQAPSQLPAAPLSCFCAGYVFMTTPVIRCCCRAAGVNTAEALHRLLFLPLTWFRALFAVRSCFVFISEADVKLCMHFLLHTHGLSKSAALRPSQDIKCPVSSASLCPIVQHKSKRRLELVQRWDIGEQKKQKKQSKLTNFLKIKMQFDF